MTRTIPLAVVCSGLLAACVAAPGDETPSDELSSVELSPSVELTSEVFEPIARRAAGLAAPELHEQFVRVLPDTARRLHVFTYVNGRGDKRTLAVDAATREVIDPTVAEEREQSALWRRCGVRDRTLCDVLERSPRGATIPVMIWLADDQPDVDRTLALRDVGRYRHALDAATNVRRQTAERVGARLEAVFARSSADRRPALGRSQFAAVLSGRLTPEEIAIVAVDPEVGSIMLGSDAIGGESVELNLASAMSLAGWSVNGAYDASGIKIGILEPGRPGNLTGLPPLTVRLPTEPLHSYTSYHARLVIGITANTSATPGFGSQASLFVANSTSADSDVADVDWAAAQGTTHHTDTRGNSADPSTILARHRYFDFMTRARALFYAGAAGNSDMRLGFPEFVDQHGFNTVSVGATYSDGRIVDGTQADACELDPLFVSGWRNSGGNQELPHIVAEGGCIDYIGEIGSGTSVATPSIVGMAAGLSELSSALTVFPEATKAILLASPIRTASLSPDGCAWRFRRNDSGACSLSDGRDGTGLVNGARARAIASRRAVGLDGAEAAHDFGFITRSSFNATTLNLSPNHVAWGPRVCAPIPYRLRAVLAWDSKVNCTVGNSSSCTDALEMDLDLRVYQEPGSLLVGQSSTTTNSYEHVDIPISGRTGHCWPPGNDWSYRIEVRLANHASLPTSASTFFGLAWQVY